MNLDKLHSTLNTYKEHFTAYIPNEIYKWKAVQHFQNHWDLEATDFKNMLLQSLGKTENLLRAYNYYPRKMLEEFCQIDAEQVRNMFKTLYNEKEDLIFRINTFEKEAKELLKKWGKGKLHYQNSNAITTYLWLRYPDKYYIYKYSCAQQLATEIEASFIPKKGMPNQGLAKVFSLYDEIAYNLQKDKDIRYLLNEALPKDCYPDPQLHTVVVDLAYFVGNMHRFHYSTVKKSLQQTPEHKSNYWWLCANPKIWSIAEWTVGQEQDYTLYNASGNKRRVFQNFLDAKAGDKVICYESNPTKQIIGLATVSKANDGKQIYFKKQETLLSPIDLSVVKTIPELANMEFLLNPNGSFFHLTEKEYTTLLDLIRETNDNAHANQTPEKYTKEDFLKEVYMSEADFTMLQQLVHTKKNVILQGAPGVGKTFCAQRLAWAMMGKKDESRIAMVQFHQNYSYEDFVMGYKPEGETFALQKGVFYQFCKTAENNPETEYFFIIDEINRGNLSKIFGELLMLIEKDHREEKLTLAYKNERFAVPNNLYLIGMMNTADRSLALIDYALRRRFSFFEMHPGFETDGFKTYQKANNNKHFDQLVEVIKELNQAIVRDNTLGTGFEIGHSYLCTQEPITDQWLQAVVRFDIIPMLQEYWFENREEVESWSNKLNAIFND